MKLLTNKTETAETFELKPKSSEKSNFMQLKPTNRCCNRCGYMHARGRCPAFGKQCSICQKLNHFAKKCNSGTKNRKTEELVETTRGDPDVFKLDSLHVYSCDMRGNMDNEWLAEVKIVDKIVTFKLDKGSQVNVIPVGLLESIAQAPRMAKANVSLECFGGFIIRPLGTVSLPLENKLKRITARFMVVNEERRPLLGLRSCVDLGLVQRVEEALIIPNSTEFIKQNQDVFNGLGCFPDICKLKLSKDATPRAHPARRVPFKIKEKLKSCLDDLVAKKVIEPVDEPCEWINSLVIVEKPDSSLRLCIDPNHLNKFLLRDYYEIPTLEEIRIKLANKSHFCLFDLKLCFHQIRLDDESSKLCCFSTPFGVYKYLRAPFGLSILPEFFQKLTLKYFGHLKNVVVYFDDILCFADSAEELKTTVDEVISVARKYNIKFNAEKIQYFVNEVRYLGFIFTKDGYKVDQDRIESILNLKPPRNVKDLQKILGMINFLRNFILHLSELCAPLTFLLKKDSVWLWTDYHNNTFVQLKKIISDISLLACFDPTKKIEIQADSSSRALGCSLLQEGKPILYASRALTSCEQEYAQIEKDLLAITFAFSKFHNYVYGHTNVMVYTDHSPLTSIIFKDLEKIKNNRLKRLRLKLLPYRFDLKYLPGKSMVIGDLLSRNFLKKDVEDDESMRDVIHTVGVQFDCSDTHLKNLKTETANDAVLSAILKFYLEGWPKSLHESGDLNHYYKMRNDITVENGLIYFEDRLIVPPAYRKRILHLLHETHLGLHKTKVTVKRFFYWPGVMSDVTNVVNTCKVCQRFQRSKTKESMLPREIPPIPFNKVGMDVLEFGGKYYLVVIDYYSRWIELSQLKDKSSTTIIKCLKSMFASFGIPKIVIADNNPFSSFEFIKFSEEWNFNIITSSPYYPKSNGLAEKAVGVVKSMLKKCCYENDDIELYLLNYRNSPVAGLGYSPSQLLQSRILRTKLPIGDHHLFPKIIRDPKVCNKDNQTIYYNQHCIRPEEFVEGDQLSTFLLTSDVKNDLLLKRNKDRRNNINKIQRSIWCLGSSLERSFLFEIPPTLTIARRFYSRHIPPKCMSKTGSKKTNEVDRLTIIPAWMKKPKVKKFQEHVSNIKNKSQNISQNKTLHEFHVPGPKFKMTNFIEKKTKTMQSITEPLKPKKIYKTVINKISLPHFETKHLVLKKKNIKKESNDSQDSLENSIKDVINSNIPKNYKIILSSFNKTDHSMKKPSEESQKLENERDTKEPKANNENKMEKSEVVVAKNIPMQPNNKNDDRSQIRRHKAKNEIVKIDEKLFKSKAKRFEKREVDMFIKKLASKYGKVAVQKSAKPIRTYENNRPRIKYDFDTQKHLINAGKTGPMTRHALTSKVETKIPSYSKKKLNEFLKNHTENTRILKKENSLLVNKKTTTNKMEEKPKGGIISRKEDLSEVKKSQTVVQLVNKKSNSAIKLNSKNGFLKDRDKHVTTAEDRKKKSETESFTNARDYGKGNECTNDYGIKSRKSSQNENKNINNHLIPYSPKNIGSSLILAKPETTKFQKDEIPSIDGVYESSKNVKRFTKCKKTDDKLQILSNNQSNNKTKLMISDILSNKVSDYPSTIENMVGESKNEQKKNHSIETMEENSTEQLRNISNEKGQHTTLMADTSNKTTEQMKYIKYTPDSQNYICASKQKIVACKYKISRGVHSDKPDISIESKKHLINAQPDFRLNNKTRLSHSSRSSKLTTEEGTATSVNNNLPSKVEFIKKLDKNILVPSKIYKFHCHSESLDYKVYKYDNSSSVSLETNTSKSIKPNKHEIQTGNLEKINTSKQRGYQSFEHGNRQIDIRNRKLTNINIVRPRVPPIVNLKKDELTTKKDVPQLTGNQQPENLQKRENLCLTLNRVHGPKPHTFDKENLSTTDSELSRQMKVKNAMQLKESKDERYHKGIGNIDKNKKNLPSSNSSSEKSNCGDNKAVQKVNLEKQIKDEDGIKFGVGEKASNINDNKVKLPFATREIHKPKGYNMDYSRRELKKILPYIKNVQNKRVNICSKEDKNYIDPCNEDVSNNNYLMPHVSAIKNKTDLSKTDNLKASDSEILKFEVQKNKQTEEMQIGGSQIKANTPPTQQLVESRLQSGIVGESKMPNGYTEKKVKSPTFVDEKKTGVNILYYEDVRYKHKKDFDHGVKHPSMTKGIQKYKMDPKSTSWMDKFHELVINKDIFNKKVKKNVFLMHGFNKVSFLKGYEDIDHVTSPLNIFPKLVPKTSISKNANEELHENKINGLQVLENDLKEILYQQLELYNKGIKHKYPETNEQNEIKKIYDLFDCSFILQNFNKVSLNCDLPKHLGEENVCPLNTSSNDFDLINGKTEKKCNKIVSFQTESKKDDSDMIEKIKTCGRLIIKENPKDISFIEVLDCKIPMKCTKSSVKESSTDDKGSQMFSLINSKHMCFYSKYRKNCMEQNVINHMEANKKAGKENIRVVTKNAINQDSMASRKVNYLESMPKNTFQGMTILPINMKMLTFREIYDYNYRKNAGIDGKKNKYLQLDDKEKNNIETKTYLEKEPLTKVKQEKNTNNNIQATSEPFISHSFLLMESPNMIKIEPEILHYMKKLDILSSNNGLTITTKEPNSGERNTNGSFFATEAIQKNYLNSNEPHKHSSKITTNASNHNTGNLFIKEICYSTDIKFLEKNTTDIYEVINDCKRGTFEYLTKVIKKHKKESKFLHGLDSSNIPGKLVKSDKVFRSNNHKGMEDETKPFPGIPTLDSPALKMTTVRNDKELEMTTQNMMKDSLKKNKENEFNSGINSNINEAIPAEFLENNFNKLKVMKTIKEQEKQLFHIKKVGNSLPQIKNEEFRITGDTNQIKSGIENLKPNNMLTADFLTNQNELMSYVNMESTNKKSLLHSNHIKKNKAESGSKIKHTIDKHNVKDEDDSFQNMCYSKNTNIQNYNNSYIERKEKHLDIDDTRTSNKLRKAICNVHTVLNNKYAPITRKCINDETQSNLSFNEAKNLTKNFNLKNISNYPAKMAKNDVINESIIEPQQVGKMNFNEVTTEKTDDESSNHINIKSKENCIKTNINNKIDISNSNESHVSDSIPTGLRCIRQPKIESGNDKGMERCLKKKICLAESVKLKDRDRKSIKSPLRKDIGKSVTLNLDCKTSSKLNKYLLKHKKQLEAITKDKRVKSIKNKLSHNLRPRDETKIIRRESHTLMSLMNTELVGKKISEDNKRDSRQEDGLHSQISSINKIVSTEDSKLPKRSGRNIIGKVNEIGTLFNNNSFIDMKSNPTKITTEAKIPYFNNICSENNFRHINEYKDEGFIKTEKTNLELRPSPYCVKKKLKTNQKNKYRENPIYILKAQPKVEGFISQSLRSSNAERIPSSRMFTGTTKKRSAIHLMKNRNKSELKQCITGLKQKKTKHRISKVDQKLKNDQKQNHNSLKLAHSSKIFSQKELPLHVFQKELKKLSKNYFLETPSRQVCGLTPPKRTIREKPVKPKTKVISKLVACTQQKDDVLKQNLKVGKNVNNPSGGSDVPIKSEIHNLISAKEFKSTWTEMWQIDKENTGASNLIDYQSGKSEGSLKNEENKDQNANLIVRADLKSDFEQIINKSEPVSGLSISSETAAKGSDRNDSSNSQLITDSKDDIGLPSIVGSVVNNVKARIQNFLLADIAKSKLKRGITSKKKTQHKIDDLKEKSKTPNHISQENNESFKINQNSKQILCNTIATYTNGTTDPLPSNEKIDKMKMNFKNNDLDARKTISELLKFKSVQNKQTCPQMSYSEVLNKFYAGCET